MPDPRRKGEEGAALLTVLLLVAVMSVVASTALERVALATRMTGNGGAVKLYERVGFGGYALGSTMGTANFMQKWLR